MELKTLKEKQARVKEMNRNKKVDELCQNVLKKCCMNKSKLMVYDVLMSYQEVLEEKGIFIDIMP